MGAALRWAWVVLELERSCRGGMPQGVMVGCCDGLASSAEHARATAAASPKLPSAIAAPPLPQPICDLVEGDGSIIHVNDKKLVSSLKVSGGIVSQ